MAISAGGKVGVLLIAALPSRGKHCAADNLPRRHHPGPIRRNHRPALGRLDRLQAVAALVGAGV